VSATTLNQWLIMLFFVGIVAPVAEEIIFRHMLLRPLRQYGDKQAVIITAVLFGAFHGNFTQFLYATVAGLILGIVTVRANSVKPAIVIHMLVNSYEVSRSYLFDRAENAEAGQIVINAAELSRFFVFIFITGLVSAVMLTVMGKFKIPEKAEVVEEWESVESVEEEIE